MLDVVTHKFKALRLKHCAENIEGVIKRAEQHNHSCLQTIDCLLDIELEKRRNNRIALRFRQSKLTEKITIDQFDFNFHPSRQKQKNLTRSGYILFSSLNVVLAVLNEVGLLAD